MTRLIRQRPLVQVLLVGLVGIAVYANTFQSPFLFDDIESITENEIIHELANFTSNSSGYKFLPNRYIAYLSFAINYKIGGEDVVGYHFVNLTIHITASLLVYVLLRLIFMAPYFQPSNLWSSPQEDSTFSPDRKAISDQSSVTALSTWTPLLAALLFVVHPIQTQAVTYVVQRITSLATLFYLLSLVLYVRARLYAASGSERNVLCMPALSCMAGSVVAAVLAMKTKEIAFTLPLAAVLCELCFFRGPWSRRGLWLLPLLITLPIIPATTLLAGGEAAELLAGAGEQFQVGGALPRTEYLATQFRVIVTYLRLLILPVNQNLDYDYPLYETFFTSPVLLSFLLLLSLLAAAVYLFFWSGSGRNELPGSDPAARVARHATRLASFGILWFFLALAVESSLVPLRDVIFEHRLYLPGFGAAVAFAAGFRWLAHISTGRAGRRVVPSLVVCLMVALGIATVRRNQVWGSAIRLWEDVLSKSPHKARPYNDLGTALEAAGRRDEAFAAFYRAVDVDPTYYKSYYNLADLHLVSERPDTAMPLLQTAIRLNADFKEAYVAMGAALVRSRRFDQAARFLEGNLGRVGAVAEARFYLGASYAFMGKRGAALRELEVVETLDPRFAASLAGLLGRRSHGSAPR